MGMSRNSHEETQDKGSKEDIETHGLGQHHSIGVVWGAREKGHSEDGTDHAVANPPWYAMPPDEIGQERSVPRPLLGGEPKLLQERRAAGGGRHPAGKRGAKHSEHERHRASTNPIWECQPQTKRRQEDRWEPVQHQSLRAQAPGILTVRSLQLGSCRGRWRRKRPRQILLEKPDERRRRGKHADREEPD